MAAARRKPLARILVVALFVILPALVAGQPQEGIASHAEPVTPVVLALATAIRELPPTHRAVLNLFYREELRVEEIASVLGIPAGTVKSRLHNARLALKQQLSARAAPETESSKRGIS